MTNEEKAKEICMNIVPPYTDFIHQNYKTALAMAQWKDLENRWHKISNGDFPKITGDYLTVCRNKNKEDGIFIYEVVYYTGDEWDENRINYEDIIAWREIPKYEE